jgi:hypothetical protein
MSETTYAKNKITLKIKMEELAFSLYPAGFFLDHFIHSKLLSIIRTGVNPDFAVGVVARRRKSQ